ncbi:lisH domain and HEAT repeat-containing protein KIAA1468-like protein [Leptotrombidium deliense]|uniref:LisH domain and HEAT repeat-containing protein KIAA1468-like protein n=1 Tax=Leptotrombidium deliense TaxID=299467 RepID=A0A443SJ63_9ACAR|nr:lisH domain and HEAT repeat-containing protein KIAA1468-like protein [Leptotrombidium deliense]
MATRLSTNYEYSDVSWETIARKLIAEGLHLTALELFAELTERGTDLQVLTSFFSNASNFETKLEVDTSSILKRSSSIQTFDSLDFARNSEDGETKVEDKIAVLEFELRKAKETISSLRADLTVVTTNNELNEPSSSVKKMTKDLWTAGSPLRETDANSSVIKPHEKRALNFLVNEYLMKHNYKMSSITFCDENSDQDFDNWEDVGLDIPQPPDILMLYRRYWASLCDQIHICDNKIFCDKSTFQDKSSVDTEVCARAPLNC